MTLTERLEGDLKAMANCERELRRDLAGTVAALNEARTENERLRATLQTAHDWISQYVNLDGHSAAAYAILNVIEKETPKP